MAESLDNVTVSEEEPELENEPSSALEAPEAESPKQTPRGASAGRSGKQRPSAPGFFARTMQFLRDTRAEMRRVTWPTANEVKNTTIITLIAVVFFALYLFGIDRVWAFLIEHLKTLLGG